ncbi:MAG TPA: Ig-like domain-containing protein [Candidatus Deferrimicrobium sp.]|nr:Ig-like domain-containing protein [Candidatus Deferrimicrobium sp.]
MDTRWIDPEIEGILDGDPELVELAHRVRAARPEPPLDPRFQAVLHAQLMREAPAVLAGAAKPEQARATVGPRTIRARRTGWWQRSPRFAWGGAALGVALVAVAVFTVARTPVQDKQVTAASPVADFHAVSPNNVITVAFNEPMNHAAVVAGLHIRPATQVTTSWQGNNLVITPTHHLAGNTPYTVTIDRSATRSAGGSLAASDIHIAFGTAPTPPPAPSVTELSPHGLASVSVSAQLISGGDGTVIATSSIAPATTPATQAPSPAASNAATPTATGIPTQTANATATATPTAASAAATPTSTGELVAMTTAGKVVDLGPAASSAAMAPNGLRLVAAVPTSSGTTIEVVSLDGSQRRTLATLATPTLATGWLSNDTALVAEPDRIVSIDLVGRVSTLAPLPAGTSRVIFSPVGGQALAGSTTGDGELIDLVNGQSRQLAGSRQTAAFSGDGQVVAWVDASANPARLLTSPVSRDAAAIVPLDHPANSVASIALDKAGTHVAVSDQPPTDGGELEILALPSGSILAHAANAHAPVFSTSGAMIAFVARGAAQIAVVPGAVAGTVVNALPDGAASALTAFVDAQVQGNTTALTTLSGSGVDAARSTPQHLSRAFVISAVPNPDGTVAATARLIVDPSAVHPAASFADEALTLSPKDGGGYVVSALTAGKLKDEPVGQQVVSVVLISGRTLVLRVSFDSDLRADIVPASITVTTRSGRPLTVTTTYDPNTRTATVTTTVPDDTAVTLHVATTLVDVDGQALAVPFSTPTGG